MTGAEHDHRGRRDPRQRLGGGRGGAGRDRRDWSAPKPIA